MYTPNEVKDISFDKAAFGGYNMAQVDKTFSSLSEDYVTLFKENTMLKKKLKLLADTVEDYRSVDEAMRKALITAQNMANDMVAEAEKKSKEIIDNASENAKVRAAELAAEVEVEERKLLEARAATADFLENVTALFDSEKAKFIEIRDRVKPAEAPEAVEESPMTDTLDDIAKAIDEKVKQEETEAINDAAPVEEPKKDADDTKSFENDIPTAEEMDALEQEANKPKKHRKVEFAELKFGKDYNISDTI